MIYIKKNKRGFTLLEVLITVIILSIGILGIVALQTKSLIYNYQSELRTIATTQLNDLIDKMLSNKVGVHAGNYNSFTSLPTTLPVCDPCSALDQATLDYYDWSLTTGVLLPNGQGTIIGDNKIFEVTIFWDQDRTGATGKNCSGNTNIDLSCIKYNITII